MKELEIYNIQTRRMMKYVCFHYEQFEADCDKLTVERYKNFTVNPKNRFETRMEKVTEQLLSGERVIPSHLCLRLENRHSICNCRIDYVFEIFDMKSLREDIRKEDFSAEEWIMCEKSNVDYVLIYIGMNK